jgi:multidrug efflux pump subunit AcrA (membrane-fusion protein)
VLGVEAYIDDVFTGVVKQVWLQPETISNVVMYTVVVDADNSRGLLYPGMTATTDFLVDERKDVLLVPNKALTLKATPKMFEEMRGTMEEHVAELPDSIRQAVQERMAHRGGGGGSYGGGGGASYGGGGANPYAGTRDDNSAMLWYLDDKGRLTATRIVKGVTDGRVTEVVSGKGVVEGMKVIVAVNEEEDGGSSNPLATGPFGRRH